MYVTRPLSLFKQHPEYLSLDPQGPSSGYLLIQDEETETMDCCGGSVTSQIADLPFPQNKMLKLSDSDGATESVVMIPVLNQPLSSNRYYAILSRGKHKGEACTCSQEDDMHIGCCGQYVGDSKSRPLDPENIYQQVEISLYRITCGRATFFAKSVVEDGYPPDFLRTKGWDIETSPPKFYELGEAQGLDSTLRARLPSFDFPLTTNNSEGVVVGKWYCPFMFVKDGSLEDQMKRSMFYEMTLEQRWEQIFSCDNDGGKENYVAVDVVVERKVVFVAGKEVVNEESNVVDRVMWFRVAEERVVGLSLAIIERMKWEEERFGWVRGDEMKASVKRVDEFGGNGEWRTFGCYILVERFVLKRMDGSLVLTYDFKHTHHVRSKWE